MAAHGKLAELESSFDKAAASPTEQIPARWELLLADPEYQRAITEASYHGACQHLPRTLTGPVNLLEGVLAVRALAAEVEKAEWAQGLRASFLPAVDRLRKLPLPEDAETHYKSAQQARGSALGLLLDQGILGTELLQRPRGFASVALEAPSLAGEASRRSNGWADSVVVVETKGSPSQRGSGVFLGPSYILTAAHVVAGADAIRVYSPRLHREFEIVSRPLIHTGWGHGKHRDLDYAALEVQADPELGVPVLWDFGAPGGAYQIARYGYPPSGERWSVGSVERYRNMFFSADLQVPHGASGGGIFYDTQGTVSFVGITTNEDIAAPPNKSFVGLALVKSELRNMQ
jgi:hypothetical protein